MLVINEDLMLIEDSIDQLVKELLSSEAFINYQEKLRNLEQDKDLQAAISQLNQLRDSYTSESEFIKFRPELKELRRMILAKKEEA